MMRTLRHVMIYRDHSVPERVVCWREGENIGQSPSAPAQNKTGATPRTNNGSTTKTTLKNAPSHKIYGAHDVTSSNKHRGASDV